MKFTAIIYFSIVALVMVNGDDDDDDDLTPCQSARKKSQESKVQMKIIFECDEDGNYQPLQCFQNSKFCVCYSEDGIPISPMSSKLKQCECRREAEKAESENPGGYVPACDDDGSYFRKQCDPSKGVCWCVDKYGKRLTEETSDPLSC